MRLVSWIAATLLLSACAGAPVAKKSLYDELGGQTAVTRLVDRLVTAYKADPRIAARFELPPEELAYLRERLIEQFCQLTGGPCEYTGLSMREAHSGLNITAAEFDAFVEDSVYVMREMQIRRKHRKLLLAALAPMQADVVGQ